MERHRKAARTAGLLALAATAWACESGTDPVTVGSVEIGPVPPELAVGGTAQLAATVLSGTGSVLSGHPVTWSSDRPAVASVSAGGLVEGLTSGTARIRARSGGVSDEASITVVPGPCEGATEGSLSLGETRTGALRSTDCRLLYYATRSQGWSFELGTRALVEADLTGDFPAGLMVTDSDMVEVAWGYEEEGGASLIADLPPGSYILWVVDYSDGAFGNETYELYMGEAAYCDPGSASTGIAPGETRDGNLARGDCLFLHGVRAHGFRLDLTEATGIGIDLTSADFDALVVVTDLEMQVLWWNDDWGSSLNSRIERRIPAGQYIVWATGYWLRSAGAYRLSVAEAEPCAAVGSVGVGEAVDGALSSTDCYFDGQRYADAWILTVESGATVQLDLTSDQFDTYLVLEDADGQTLAWDDDGGSGLNSRLVLDLDPGEYRVVVTSYGPGATGGYQLSAAATSGAPAGRVAPPPGADLFRRKIRKP